MIRYTKRDESGGPALVTEELIEPTGGGYTGKAVERLARFEALYEGLLARQEEITEKLEELRLKDKKNSVKFKELLGEKLMNNNMIILFKTYVDEQHG